MGNKIAHTYGNVGMTYLKLPTNKGCSYGTKCSTNLYIVMS